MRTLEELNPLGDSQNLDIFIGAIGSEIEQAQVKLITAANAQMLLHYWKIGHFILAHQKHLGWGAKVIEKISQAICSRYPEKKGYAPRNLKYMCQFARLYSLHAIKQLLWADEQLRQPSVEKVILITRVLGKKSLFGQQAVAQFNSCEDQSVIFGQQPVAQFQNISETLAAITQQSIAQIEEIFLSSPLSKINWAGHIVLMDSKLSEGVRYWYMKQTVEFGWSRSILKMQIDNNLFRRQIEKQKVNNFTATLPKPQSDLANYFFKDPYIFDLANFKEQADEHNVEEQLVNHVTKYLIEMGIGFAFVARQKHFQVGDSDFYADLILYNIQLHAFVVIELKATPFKPEYAGQLNFYINLVDDKLRGPHDNKTVGLLLCKGKDEIMAQYALSGYNQPISVSDYQLSKAIPDNLKSALPSIEEVEEELWHLFEQHSPKTI